MESELPPQPLHGPAIKIRQVWDWCHGLQNGERQHQNYIILEIKTRRGEKGRVQFRKKIRILFQVDGWVGGNQSWLKGLLCAVQKLVKTVHTTKAIFMWLRHSVVVSTLSSHSRGLKFRNTDEYYLFFLFLPVCKTLLIARIRSLYLSTFQTINSSNDCNISNS